MKFLKPFVLQANTQFCWFDRAELSNVNRTTDEQLENVADHVEEEVERRIAAGIARASLNEVMMDLVPANTTLVVDIFHNGASRLRVRNDKGKVVNHVNEGDEVIFTGEKKTTTDNSGQADGADADTLPDSKQHLWFKVKYAGGSTGWVSAEYLKLKTTPTAITDEPHDPGVIVPERDGGGVVIGGDGDADLVGDPRDDIPLPLVPALAGAAGNTVLGRQNEALLSNARNLETVWRDLPVAEKLDFLNYLNLESLNPAQKADFLNYLRSISDPETFETFIRTTPAIAPELVEAYDAHIELQKVNLQTQMFMVYLQVQGFDDPRLETELGPILEKMEAGGLTLEQVFALRVPPIPNIKFKRLKNHFTIFKRKFPLVVGNSVTDLKDTSKQQLHTMAKMARENEQYELAGQLYRRLLQGRVEKATTTADFDQKVADEVQERRDELTDEEISQALQGAGIENPTKDQIKDAKEASLLQYEKEIRTNLMIEDEVLALSDDIIKEYKDMEGIGWLDWSDSTKETVWKEALATVVIGVATMGTGLVLTGIVRGAMLGARAARGLSLTQKIGLFGTDMVGSQLGYSVSASAINDFRGEGNFTDNFYNNMTDGHLWLSNGVSMGLARGLHYASRSSRVTNLNTWQRRGAIATMGVGATYTEAAVSTGEIDPTDPQFMRAALMGSIFNAWALKSGGPAKNLNMDRVDLRAHGWGKGLRENTDIKNWGTKKRQAFADWRAKRAKNTRNNKGGPKDTASPLTPGANKEILIQPSKPIEAQNLTPGETYIVKTTDGDVSVTMPTNAGGDMIVTHPGGRSTKVEANDAAILNLPTQGQVTIRNTGKNDSFEVHPGAKPTAGSTPKELAFSRTTSGKTTFRDLDPGQTYQLKSKSGEAIEVKMPIKSGDDIVIIQPDGSTVNVATGTSKDIIVGNEIFTINNTGKRHTFELTNKPTPAASLSLFGTSKTLDLTTLPDGRTGFKDLDPGTYTIRSSQGDLEVTIPVTKTDPIVIKNTGDPTRRPSDIPPGGNTTLELDGRKLTISNQGGDLKIKNLEVKNPKIDFNSLPASQRGGIDVVKGLTDGKTVIQGSPGTKAKFDAPGNESVVVTFPTRTGRQIKIERLDANGQIVPGSAVTSPTHNLDLGYMTLELKAGGAGLGTPSFTVNKVTTGTPPAPPAPRGAPNKATVIDSNTPALAPGASYRLTQLESNPGKALTLDASLNGQTLSFKGKATDGTDMTVAITMPSAAGFPGSFTINGGPAQSIKPGSTDRVAKIKTSSGKGRLNYTAYPDGSIDLTII